MSATGLQQLILVIAALLASLPDSFTANIVGPFLKFFWIFLLRGG